ncbi:MAG: hypothetical protein HDS99_01610 [Bacteroidales bacterium]|nr:hypothetical protein [Bacteroidales bacterium]
MKPSKYNHPVVKIALILVLIVAGTIIALTLNKGCSGNESAQTKAHRERVMEPYPGKLNADSVRPLRIDSAHIAARHKNKKHSALPTRKMKHRSHLDEHVPSGTTNK